MMRPAAILLFVLVFLFVSVPVSTAHNPFTSKPGKNHKTIKNPVKGKFLVKIVFWQHKIREKMAGLIREAKSEKKITPVVVLFFFAFLYGVIHSAGPGHGKAVALSYILTCRPSLSQSLAFGNFVALIHGFSGIFFVLVVKFVLHTSINQSLDTMTYITQVISFSLISLMGTLIFIKSLLNWFRDKAGAEQRNSRLFSNPVATAFAVGIIPCPGVVMVMLFAISLQLTWLGIFLGATIAFGMASTITIIVLAGMSGKAAALELASGHTRTQMIVSNSIETLAGLLVACLGVILLLANL